MYFILFQLYFNYQKQFLIVLVLVNNNNTVQNVMWLVRSNDVDVDDLAVIKYIAWFNGFRRIPEHAKLKLLLQVTTLSVNAIAPVVTAMVWMFKQPIVWIGPTPVPIL